MGRPLKSVHDECNSKRVYLMERDAEGEDSCDVVPTAGDGYKAGNLFKLIWSISYLS